MIPVEAIARLRTRNADAADLAALCSLAVQVEPQLLRRLRLLLAGADVAAETDLWSSPLVASASVVGLSLRTDVAQQLCPQLRLPRWDGLREQAIGLIDTAHARANWSVRLAEQLTRVGLEDGPSARTRELVLAAINQLTERAATPRERTGVARWLLWALARLPRSALSAEAAQAAECAANLHLGGRAPKAIDPVVEERWLPYLLRESTDTVAVPVQFQSGRLDVNRDADTVLRVPRTDPLVLDLDWTDGPQARSARLRFVEGEAAGLVVGSDRVDVRTLTGDGVRLSEPGVTRGRAGFDFGAQWAQVQLCRGRDRDLTGALAYASRATGTPLIRIAGERGTGRTTLACELARRRANPRGRITCHFFGVEPSWDDPALVRSSLQAQLAAASGDPVVVVLDDLPPSVPVGELVDTLVPPVSGSMTVIVTTAAGPDETNLSPVAAAYDIPAGAGTAGVCEAMVRAVADALATRLDAGASASADLIGRTGQNPGRLARLLDWVLAQPGPGIALADLPPPLTAAFADTAARLGGGPWLANVAVGGPGFTALDLAHLAGPEEGDELARFLAAAAAARLVHVDGAARSPNGCWLSTPLRAAAGLDRALAEGAPAALGAAHLRHAQVSAALRGFTGGLSRYESATGVAHALAAEAAGLGTEMAPLRDYWPKAAYLHLRAVDGGVAAALADLEATAHWPGVPLVLDAARYVATALAPVPPERFTDLVLNELRRRGHGEGVIGRLVDPAWPPPLAVRSVEAVPTLAAVPTDPMAVEVAGPGVWVANGAAGFADGRPAVALAGLARITAIAAGDGFVAAVGAAADAGPDAASTRLEISDAPNELQDQLLITPFGEIRPQRSGEPVHSVAFSPDGERIAVGSSGLTLADVAGSNPVELVPYPAILAVAFRSDGRSVVAVDEDGEVLVLAAAANRPIAPAPSSSVRGSVLASAVSQAGEQVAIGSTERQVRVIEIDGRQTLLPSGAPAEVLAFSPSGAVLVAGNGSSATVYDLRSGKPRGRFEHGSRLSALALSGDTGLLATGGDGEIGIHDLSGGPPVVVSIAHPGAVRALAFSADGTALVSGDMDGVAVHAVADGALLARVPHPDEVTALAFSSDGSRLATGCEDGIARVFQFAPRPDPGPTFVDLGAAVSSLDIVGPLVVVGGANGVVTCVDPTGARPNTTLIGHGAAITMATVAPGSGLATASEDGTVRVWDPDTGWTVSVLRHRTAVRRICVSGRYLVSADAFGQVRWWADGVALGPPFAHPTEVTGLVALLDGSVVSCGADATITRSWVDPDLLVRTEEWSTAGIGVRLAVAAGEFVVTSHDDGRLRWWAGGRGYGEQTLPRTARALSPADLPGSVLVVHDAGTMVAFPPTGPGDDDVAALRCLAVDSTGAVAVGTPTGSWRSDLPGHGDWAPTDSRTPGAMAFVAGRLVIAGQGELVAAAGATRAIVADGQVRLLNTTDEVVVPIDRILPPAEQPTALTLTGDGETVAGGTDRGRIAALDRHLVVRSHVLLGPAPVTAIAEYRDGFVAGTADGGLFRWHPGEPATRLAQHGDRIDGLDLVNGRVLCASADRTLRLWDAERGSELGRLAHTTGFTAVAAHPEPGRAVARTADGLIWLVDTVGFGLEPPARELFGVEALEDAPNLLYVETDRLQLSVGFRLDPAVPVEIRRITLDVDRAVRPVAPVVVSLHPRGADAEPLGPDGRLARPRRVGLEESVNARAWATYGASTDWERPWVATVRLWVVTSTRADELPFEVTVRAPAVSEFDSGSSSASTVPHFDQPITVTYGGQEEPDDVDPESHSESPAAASYSSEA